MWRLLQTGRGEEGRARLLQGPPRQARLSGLGASPDTRREGQGAILAASQPGTEAQLCHSRLGDLGHVLHPL